MAPIRRNKPRQLNVRTSGKGIRQVLGDLEADIMELCWQQDSCSVRGIHEQLAANRKIAYTTVMTVMSRLAEKGLLQREQQGRAYLYTPTCSRDEFCSDAISTVMQGLMAGFGEPVLSHFVDSIEAQDTAQLDELLRLIEAKKGESGKSVTSH
ncbi:MAG: BlaI/MecI/CopY family transcriptional regulator [Thermoleophilia bacterium]